MFGLLKSKLTSFISSLAGREEKKQGERKPEGAQEPKTAHAPEKTTSSQKAAPAIAAQVHEAKSLAVEAHKSPAKEEPTPLFRAPSVVEVEKPQERATEILQKTPEPGKIRQEALQAHHPVAKESAEAQKPRALEQQPASLPKELKQELKMSIFSSVASVFSQKPKEKSDGEQSQEPPKQSDNFPGGISTAKQPPSTDSGKTLSDVGEKALSGSKAMSPKIGIGTAIKSFFSNEITIGEGEVSDLLSELELSLLEADVAYDVSLSVTEQLRSRLVGMKVPKNEVGERTRQAIREVLESIMDNDRKFDLAVRVRSLQKPVKILFVGPNGAGKTTTMAKVARMFLDSGLSVVFSASDTFRAAAIEQAEVHAGRLGVAIVKSKYGADPSSVAFDAINYARSHSIDVVLIDSAGRQDTNQNLLDELRKMDRVAKPDMKIYIGESIGGNSIIEQIKAFNSTIGLDGAILTKLDCDAKGGTAISISHATGIPVLYLGVGQAYTDLVPFDPRKIAQEIMN